MWLWLWWGAGEVWWPGQCRCLQTGKLQLPALRVSCPACPGLPCPCAARRRTQSRYNKSAESTLVADLRPARLLSGAAGADDGGERASALAEIQRIAQVRQGWLMVAGWLCFLSAWMCGRQTQAG